MPSVHVLLAIGCLLGSLHAQVDRYGQPCSSPGAGGTGGRVPRVTVDDSPVPSQTGSFSLDIDTGMARSIAFVMFGLSNTAWSGGRLPQDLSIVGMPGCQLLVSTDAVFGLATDAAGRLRLPMPSRALRIGQKVYVQAIAAGKSGGGQSVYGISDGLSLEVVAPLANHTVAVLPDTQIYTLAPSLMQRFFAQTAWIVKHLKSRNIAFVSHVGDIVENGGQGVNQNKVEWDRADLAMRTLDGDLGKIKDGLVPYGACVGNHDLDVINVTSSAKRFVTFFGPARYKGRSWYLGSTKDGRNHAQVFRVGGLEYLNLAIEWHAKDGVIEWAQAMLATRPDLPALLTTHEYLQPGNPGKYSPAGHTARSGGENSGADLFGKLVETSPQIFAVVCGHLAGEGRRASRTAFGRDVHEMLSNYQFDPNGGNGWLRTLEIQPGQNRIEVRTSSPTYVPGTTLGRDYNNTPSSNFDLGYDAFEHRAYLGSHRVIRFREGQDFGLGSYSGTEDTTVTAVAPNQAGGAAIDVSCDRDGNKEQGLLRFDRIAGNGKGQIPPGARILRAVLTLTTEGIGADSANGGKLFRMTTDWSEASTHSSLGGGIRIGKNTRAVADVDTAARVSATGTRSFDVTAAVQAFVDGVEKNRGWAAVANGTDAWSFRSSEWNVVVERPLLTVVY